MAADITFNYPLWVAAKRLGVGLPAFPPSLRKVYRGGGSLWFSLAPTVVVEDNFTRWFSVGLPSSVPAHGLLSAAASGTVAAVTVTSQVEHLITSAHARNMPMALTTKALLQERGVVGLLLPPGMIMMACREAPFAASLFWLQPLLSTLYSERFASNNSKSAAGDQAWGPALFQYLVVGTASSVLA